MNHKKPRNIRKILLATAFTGACEQAREHAQALAAQAGAELHVLHVQVLHMDPYGLAGMADAQALEQTIADAVKQKIEAFTAPITPPIIVGEARGVTAAPAILEYASAHEIDLIVLGNHARRGIANLVLGSQAAEVVRRATVPVLVVGSDDALGEGYGCILVPVDFSAESITSLAQAADIAKMHEASLVVAHVVNVQTLPPYSTTDFEEAGRKHAHLEMAELIKLAGLPADTETLISIGKPHDRIVELAREVAADMIVMGARGHGVLEQLLLGSNTERVLRKAPCPVLAHHGVDRLRM